MPRFTKAEAESLLLRELNELKEEDEIRAIAGVLFDEYSSGYNLTSKEVVDAVSLLKALAQEGVENDGVSRVLRAKRFVVELKKNKDMDGRRISGELRATVDIFKSVYGAKAKGGRITEFVMSSLTPQPQRRHSGVDDSIHPSMAMDHDHKEIIEILKATHKEVSRTAKSNVAPVPIIPQLNLMDDPVLAYLTGEEKSLLKTYAPSILAERQKDIVFHIAGHGGPTGVGSVSPEHRIDPELLASMIHRMISSSGIEAKFTGKRAHKLKFVLHSCNSAYCEITDPTDEDAVREAVEKFSFIGRFYKELVEEYGFSNVEVVGFRGFYVPISSAGGGVRLLKALDDSAGKSLSSGTYSISKKGVVLPVDILSLLDVKLPDYQILEFKKEMDDIIEEEAPDEMVDMPGAGIRFSGGQSGAETGRDSERAVGEPEGVRGTRPEID